MKALTSPRILWALAVWVAAPGGAAVADVVFVPADSGGEGKTESGAAALAQAYRKLGAAGGTIVIRAPIRIDRNLEAPAHHGEVVVTSVQEGIDYRRTRGAKILLSAGYTTNGPTRFRDLAIEPRGDGAHFRCNGHSVVFDRGITCLRGMRGGSLPGIFGGGTDRDGRNGANVTVNSGEWGLVHGAAGNPEGGPAGSIFVTINGGTFYSGFAGVPTGARNAFSGDMTVTINGGKFYNKVAAAAGPKTIFKGRYSLRLNGGDFSSVTDLVGPAGLAGGARSTLQVGGAVDIHAAEAGTVSFTNPLREGADPWVFFHQGYYYCTMTGGVALRGYKVTNLADLRHAPAVTFWRPPPGRAYSRNLWSPEIHYLDEREAGRGGAGWYLYVACDDGDNANHRMYVLRALSDDPLGPYGSVQTREVGVPTLIAGAEDRSINAGWSVGPTLVRHAGRLFLMWVERLGGPHEAVHEQYICLAELERPSTVKGKKTVICRPTLEWECHGAGVFGKGIRFPKVVEGGTPVYDRGRLHCLVYSGSGYWTSRYALGVLRFVGDDPLDVHAWEKQPQPILMRSTEVNGTGHASFTTCPLGAAQWAVYHGYVGARSPSNPRQMLAEPLTIDGIGAKLGDGRGQPQPLGTVMTMPVNPLPIARKISGFTISLAESLHDPSRERNPRAANGTRAVHDEPQASTLP